MKQTNARASFADRWNDFWFRPAPPDNLGLCRIIFYGVVFLYYLLFNSEGHLWAGDFSAWAQVSHAFWRPTWLFARFHVPVFPQETIVVLQVLWKLSLALSCIGLFTKLSTAISFALGLYFLGLPHNFGEIHHQDAILIFIFLILAFSRCGQSWSVDHLMRRARYNHRGSEEPVRDGENTWPVRMIWGIMALAFFAAGVSKLRHSGLAWITSDNMATQLIKHAYHTAGADAPTRWGFNLAQSHWLPHLIAAGTVILEVGYPIALFSRKARWFFVPGSMLMLLGIAMVLGPRFYPMVFCQLFWVPWDRVVARLGLQVPASSDGLLERRKDMTGA